MVFFYKKLARKIRLTKVVLFFVPLFLLQTGFYSFAQTDTEFWFVVPEITISHQSPGGVPASFRISSGQFPTTVTISMPANAWHPVANPDGFPDITINMAPNSFHIEDVSCWIVTPCLASFPVGAAVADHAIPRMENKPVTPSGVNNFGVNITSNNPITVYYEVSRENNKEIWALKGKNGLGTEFFTPFQTQNNNWNGGTTKAYSAIDVVAIEDNTSVTFTLPTGIAASYGSNFDVIPPGTTYTVNNLLKGQTFSLFPEYKVDRISQAAADRLAGVKITSNNPIAVTVKDDSFYHLGYSCYDTAGDQLVPTNIIGKEYAIIRSELFDNDHIYMLAVEDVTEITVWNQAGTAIATNTIDAQEQWYRALPAGNDFYRVTSDKPIYVWHVGGFGCEQGGALLPPIDICTGTTRVAFARTSSETFYILMMVRKGAETDFRFMVQTAPNSGVFDDRTYLLANPFIEIPNSNWSVRRFGPFTEAQVPVTNHYMENTDDIFHLGIVNGGGSSGCYYGYFSDYNEIKVDAVVAGTGSAMLKACYGIPVQLHATGGTTYKWWPEGSLSSSTAQSPFANPGANEVYFVEVSGACDMTDTAEIQVQVSTPIEALFTADKVSGCAPLDVEFTNLSIGASYYRWDFGDGTAFSYLSTPPIHRFENDTDTIVNYTVTLLARNPDFCSSIYTITIEVLPFISANFNQALSVDACDNPRDVQFTNTSTNNTADTYVWHFGDLNNLIHTPTILPYDPFTPFTHSYVNATSTPQTYNVEMIAISPFGCRDTAINTVRVTSFFEPLFNVDKANGCANPALGGLVVNVANISQGDIDNDSWTIFPAVAGAIFPGTNANTNIIFPNATNAPIIYTISLTVTNIDGCPKTTSSQVEVYPQVTPAFTLPTDACNETPVNFIDATFPVTVPASTYSWTFGDGAGSSLAPTILNPLYHTYYNVNTSPAGNYISNTYSVKLKVTSPWGCNDSITHSINVAPFVRADFNFIPGNICSGEQIVFSNNSSGNSGDSHLWVFGDGTPDYGLANPPDKEYTNTTVAPITRTITYTRTTSVNALSCPSSVQHNVIVYPEVNIVSVTPDNIAICDSTQVVFTTTITQPLPNMTYTWSFGDGTPGGGAITSHIFRNTTNAQVTYPVLVEARSEYGCWDTEPETVNVEPYIKAQASANKVAICSGESIDFSYLRMPPSIQSYSFAFVGYTDDVWPGDAGDLAAIGNFTKTFTNQTGVPMNITVRLTVNNSNPTCTKTFEIPLTIYPEVTASFTQDVGTNALHCNPLSVDFTNSTVFTGGAAFNGTYLWEFSDGPSSEEISPTHIFVNTNPNNSATFTINLTSTSVHGCKHTVSQDVLVQSRLEAFFSFSQSSQCTPVNITFNPSTSVGAAQYNWNYSGIIPTENLLNNNPFSRTINAIDPNVTINYPVTLTVTNSAGCTEDYTAPISIHPLVVAAFAPDLVEGCADFEVEFSNTSTGGNLLFDWNFGNLQGYSTPSAIPFTHTFTNRGSVDSVYTVTLITTNINTGCDSSVTFPIRVHPKVEANYTLRVIDLCEPMQVELTNASLNGSNFSWAFTPENAFGALQNAATNNHIDKPIVDLSNNAIDDNVTYTITFNAQTVWNTGLPNFTCTSSAPVQTISVAPKLELHYADPSPICSGLTGADITFSKNLLASTGGSATLQWNFQDGNTATSSYGDMVHRFVNLGPSDFTLPTLVSATQISTGCTHDTTINVRVHPKVESIFTFRFDSLCTPFDVEFTNSSLNGTEFIWDYGYTVGGVQQTQVTNAPTMGHTFTFDSDELNAIQYPNIILTSNQYHAISDSTCSHSSTRPIAVYPHLVSNFSLDRTEGCNPLTVNVTNESSGLGQYLWTFGDNTGNTTNDIEFDKIYSHADKMSSKNYEIRLQAKNDVGCVREAVQTVSVYPLVVADFIAENPIGCSPLDVLFQNLSTSSAYQYNWDFVYGGQTSGLVQPTGTIRFENIPANPLQNNVYIVSLTTGLNITTDILETCAKTVTAPITIHPRVYPQFSANFDGCHPHPVVFNNQTNAFGGIGNATYLWSFGNSVTSTIQDPAQTYLNTSFTENKTFDVSLMATSEHGCDSTINQTVTVYPKPKARMELITPYLFCPGELTEIDNQSIGTTLTYLYEFGDGVTPDSITMSSDNMVHEYNNLGSDIAPFTISLTATTENDCVDRTSQTIYVFPRVTAEFDFNPGNAACNPFTVTMVNETSNAYYYTWDFDNGLSSSLYQPTHRFINNTNQDRVFNVNLYAMSEYECEHDTTMVLTVYAAPVAEFVIDPPLKVFPDATFSFNNLTQPLSTNWSYYWTFGDGYNSNLIEPGTHTYDTWGPIEDDFSYSVWLRVENEYCADEIQHFLTLRPAAPEVLFSSEHYEACSPLEVFFINESQYGSYYTWSVGDSVFSNNFEPSFTFSEPGYYNVKLVVTGDGGERHYYRTYQVFQNPIADFNVVPERVLLPNADVHLYDLSKYASTYLWNMGDGAVYYDRNPIHKYTEIGEYRVTLTVWSDKGCENTTSKFPAVWVEGYGDLRFPNAFIPSKLGPSENGEYDAVDFKNEIFHPVHHGVEEYKLIILNRWGQQVFESNNVLNGWDGYYDRKLLPQDVYVWRATGKYVNGEQFDMRGNVTLLR